MFQYRTADIAPQAMRCEATAHAGRPSCRHGDAVVVRLLEAVAPRDLDRGCGWPCGSAAHEFPDEGAWQADVGGRGGVRDELRRGALHGRFGGPDAGLKALPDHRLGPVKCAEVVAVEMTVALDDASTASGVLEVCGSSECGSCGMQARQDHESAGAQHPAQLGDGPAEVGDVLKRQRAHHQIDAGRSSGSAVRSPPRKVAWGSAALAFSSIAGDTSTPMT